MPTARSKALAARAGRSFIDPVKQTLPSERAKAQEEGLVTVWSEDSSSGWRINGQPRPLVVLDKNGQWRPARSLYEYVHERTFPWFKERRWDFYLQPINAWPAGTSIKDKAHPDCRGEGYESDAKSGSDSDSDSDSDAHRGGAGSWCVYPVKRRAPIKRSRKNAKAILGFGYY